MSAAVILMCVLAIATAAPDGFKKQPRSDYKIQPHFPHFKLPAFVPRKKISCSRKLVKTKLSPGESITFQSPNYPSDYDSKSLCKWRFSSTVDIKIICSDFLLQKENKKGKCADKLTLDGTQFCGSSLSSYSGDKSVNVVFKSNKKKNYDGFSCTATAESGTTVTTTPGTCICGKTNRATRIVGGVTTEVHEYPWQVALVSRGGSGVFCGGSLINDRWVLTAAHCTQSGVSQVLLGNHLQSQTDSAERRINVRRVVDHPNYNYNTLDNDFSLLELSTPVDLESVDPEIRPVCLPSSSNPSQYEGVPAVVSGWGTTSSGGSQPDALREATVRTMSNAVCNQDYGGAITNAMICAANSNPARDSCQGDSGGPLVRNVGGYFNQIGVVSWGFGCADPNYPGVYSRVTDAISWITSTSSSGTTCSPPS